MSNRIKLMIVLDISKVSTTPDMMFKLTTSSVNNRLTEVTTYSLPTSSTSTDTAELSTQSDSPITTPSGSVTSIHSVTSDPMITMETQSISMTTGSPETSQPDWTTVASHLNSSDGPGQSESITSEMPPGEEDGHYLWWSLVLVIVLLSCLLLTGLTAIVCYLKR